MPLRFEYMWLKALGFKDIIESDKQMDQAVTNQLFETLKKTF